MDNLVTHNRDDFQQVMDFGPSEEVNIYQSVTQNNGQLKLQLSTQYLIEGVFFKYASRSECIAGLWNIATITLEIGGNEIYKFYSDILRIQPVPDNDRGHLLPLVSNFINYDQPLIPPDYHDVCIIVEFFQDIYPEVYVTGRTIQFKEPRYCGQFLIKFLENQFTGYHRINTISLGYRSETIHLDMFKHPVSALLLFLKDDNGNYVDHLKSIKLEYYKYKPVTISYDLPKSLGDPPHYLISFTEQNPFDLTNLEKSLNFSRILDPSLHLEFHNNFTGSVGVHALSPNIGIYYCGMYTRRNLRFPL